ncbi:unnamed protein product, partial [Polarella glacialis]
EKDSSSSRSSSSPPAIVSRWSRQNRRAPVDACSEERKEQDTSQATGLMGDGSKVAPAEKPAGGGQVLEDGRREVTFANGLKK